MDATGWQRAQTGWFRDAKWGVFLHYLSDGASCQESDGISVDDWNRRIDAYDAELLASQMDEVQAGYLCITLGQNSGFYISPNSAYDAVVGRKPSRCSSRDLVADLAAALKKRGIPLMVYFTCAAPANDRQAIEAFKCTPPWDASLIGLHPGKFTPQVGVDERMSEFQRLWEGVIREWSTRWGHDVRGWWLDGCYQADRMYRHQDEPNFRTFASAFKAGNADSLVAFNPGVKTPVVCVTEYEDYTAGELDSALPVSVSWPGHNTSLSRFVNGAQYHVLTFMAEFWGRGEPRFCDELAAAYTKQVNGHDGVVTWDVPPLPEGGIPEAFIRQLKAVAKATR